MHALPEARPLCLGFTSNASPLTRLQLVDADVVILLCRHYVGPLAAVFRPVGHLPVHTLWGQLQQARAEAAKERCMG